MILVVFIRHCPPSRNSGELCETNLICFMRVVPRQQGFISKRALVSGMLFKLPTKITKKLINVFFIWTLVRFSSIFRIFNSRRRYSAVILHLPVFPPPLCSALYYTVRLTFLQNGLIDTAHGSSGIFVTVVYYSVVKINTNIFSYNTDTRKLRAAVRVRTRNQRALNVGFCYFYKHTVHLRR